jgi:hypothetical protein
MHNSFVLSSSNREEDTMSSATPAAYPISYDVERQLIGRNRATNFFRIILAIPHLVLIGGPGVAVGAAPFFFSRWGGDGYNWGWGGAALSEAAGAMAIIAWFAIIFWRRHPRGLWDFGHYYLRWKARALAYIGLLRDEYPPFGDSDYPVSFAVGDMPADDGRDRWAVGLRLIYAIPHFIILFFLGIAWVIVTFIVWLIILFTGAYPEGLYNFSVGYLRWSLRVEGYVLLLRDEYPPFSLE